MIHPYTNGSCSGNPDPGSWVLVLEYSDHRMVGADSVIHTTTMRMKLWAVISGLSTVTHRNIPVRLYGDQDYATKVMNLSIQDRKLHRW
ncbi:MAG: RNase H family protein [Anaerolineales bacterium]